MTILTSTDDRLSATVRMHVIPARLALTPSGRRSGRLDGAWWPRSRDLAAELPSLVRAMEDVGVITRATVNPGQWQDIPRRIPVSGRIVKVGWFADEQDVHEIMLLSHRVGRWDLLVVPPDTQPAAAARLMEAAAYGGDLRTASELVEALAGRRDRAPETSTTLGAV